MRPSNFYFQPPSANVLMGRTLAWVLVCLLSVVSVLAAQASAESLFRASASVAREQYGYTPKSIYNPPISSQVGDVITILLDDSTTLSTTSQLKITRAQTINENGTTMYNGTLDFFLSKLPFKLPGVKTALTAPSFNGLDNSNDLTSNAEASRDTQIKEDISCQVIQVLPNGNLIVQGHKTLMINKDRQDLVISGIVNPFYLTKKNTIDSKYVANLQMMQGGNGVVSRQQNDGLANKIYQFFN